MLPATIGTGLPKKGGVRESHFRSSRRTRSRCCVDVKAVVNKGIWRREPVSDPRPAEPSWTLRDGFCPVNTETPSSAVHRPRPEMIRMPRQLLLPRTRNSLLRVASEFPPHNECASVRPRDSECDQGGNHYIRAAGQGRTQARALQKPLARPRLSSSPIQRVRNHALRALTYREARARLGEARERRRARGFT